MTEAEMISKLTKLVIQYTAKDTETALKDPASKQEFFYSFDIPGTSNRAFLAVRHSITGPGQRLRAIVSRNQSDFYMECELCHGSYAGILEYLADENLADRLIEMFRELSDKVDDHLACDTKYLSSSENR